MKSEMKFHLIETVEELKKEGKSEEESIRIAISRFGEITQIKSELSSVIPITKKTLNTAVWASVVAIVLLFVFMIVAINQDGANVELYQGIILAFAIPIYIIIKSTRLNNSIKLNQRVDMKKEVLVLLFFYLHLLPNWNYVNISNTHISKLLWY